MHRLDRPVIVGISAHFHDAACSVLVGGKLVAAAHEERYSRVKQDPRLPREAFVRCLRAARLTIADIDCIAYYEDPVKKLDRQLWMALPALPDSRPEAMFRLDADRPRREIRDLLGFDGPIEIVDHHLSHAASAYYFSGFESAAVLTVDAVGEWTTTGWGRGDGDRLDMIADIEFPHSLGLLYSVITGHLGFEVNEGEYKVMGLAPYGQPRYADKIREIITVAGDGTFTLDQSFFNFDNPRTMASPKLSELLGFEARMPESPVEERHSDLARSIQLVTEETLLAMTDRAMRLVPSENLCMAGGVALNVVALSRINREGPFRNIFVQPAAGDAGGSLGAAAVAHRRLTGQAIRKKRLLSALLGPTPEPEAVALALGAAGSPGFQDFRGNEDGLLDEVAALLADGKIAGWYHGRMEFGPRALGSRSILADPRRDDMRDKINASVKMRESFRPFAPAVLAEKASDHFRIDHMSPFMLETCEVISPISLPAITHVDNSARIQTVTEADNGRFYRLIRAFEHRTDCPLLLNTSFNLRGEPIVCTHIDALLCFLRSQIDCLVLDDFVIDRTDVPDAWLKWFAGTLPPRQRRVSDSVYTLL